MAKKRIKDQIVDWENHCAGKTCGYEVYCKVNIAIYQVNFCTFHRLQMKQTGRLMALKLHLSSNIQTHLIIHSIMMIKAVI